MLKILLLSSLFLLEALLACRYDVVFIFGSHKGFEYNSESLQPLSLVHHHCLSL